MDEKRKSKRIPLEGNLAMNRIDGTKREMVPIQITDISKSGMGFECARDLAMGSVYEIELVLWTKDKIKCFINITRRSEIEGKRIYGASFVGFNENDARRIDVYDLFNS